MKVPWFLIPALVALISCNKNASAGAQKAVDRGAGGEAGAAGG